MKLLKALIYLILIAVIGAGIAAGAGYVWVQGQIDAPGPSTTQTVFEVKPGDSIGAVGARLVGEGLIDDARILRLHARLTGQETAIKVGEYEISPGASVSAILDQLVEGKAVLHRITVPEGRTSAQIMALIEGDPILVGDMPDEIPAEGTLLPDTYLFGRGMTRQQMIDKMAAAQDDLLNELWPARAEGLPITSPADAVILASIVEKETGVDGERGKIAGLFTTRLKRGMRLESDPTIIYGITKGEPLYNRRGQRRTLYRSEIDRRTDWNTYQIDGLPVTPICNPGRDAIAAVLNPPDTDYIFFVADGKGGHLFAETLAEHNRNVAKYRAYERAEIARERANDD